MPGSEEREPLLNGNGHGQDESTISPSRPYGSTDPSTEVRKDNGSNGSSNSNGNSNSTTTVTAANDPQNAEAAEQEEGEEDDDDTSDYSTLQLVRILSGLHIAAVLAALDSTLTATLVAPITSSFESLTLLPWLATAYFIANAASQPVSGKLSDIYGRRASMLAGSVLFGCGNLACAYADSPRTVVAGRVVAGLGGGVIGPVGSALVSDLVPLRRRGLWQGSLNICYGIGSAAGGPVGGWIADALGWRSAFLLQIPLTLLSMVLIIFFQHSPPPPPPPIDPTTGGEGNDDDDEHGGTPKYKRIDFLGSFTLVSSLVLMLLGLNAGGNLVGWSDPLVLLSLPLSAVLLVAFAYVEKRVAKEPIIPFELLAPQERRGRSVLAALLANWFVSGARFGFFFLAPVFFYAIDGLDATRTGLRFVPECVMVGVSSVAYGLVMRATGRYRALGILGGALICAGVGLGLGFGRAGGALGTALPFVAFGLIGAGFGGVTTVTIIALVAAVEQRHQAVITSAAYAFRSTGTSVGIALASVVFQNVLRVQLRDRLGGGIDDDAEADRIARLVRHNVDAIKTLPDAWREAARDAFVAALHAGFALSLGLAVVGLVMLALLREHQLHKRMSRDD